MIRISFILLFSWQVVSAQTKQAAYKTSILQLGLFPGVSTNGLNPGEYENLFAFNLFTGYGYSTRIFELNGLAGFNTASSSGIHLSGLANFIGGNSLVGLTEKEKRSQRRRGFETSLTGFQVSGVLNYVETNTTGAQVTLGVNNTAKYVLGVQLAGLVNYAGSFVMGTQVSGLGNIACKSVSGVMAGLLFNYTSGSASGIQFGFFNKAGIIHYLKGPSPSTNTALQLGGVNLSGDMGGWQVGLFNKGKEVSGVQLGLINVFKMPDAKDYKAGPAFGLLNFGFLYNPKLYSNEIFLTNYGLVTGKPINIEVRSASRTVYSYNEITYSTNYKAQRNVAWGAGYSLGLLSFSRSFNRHPIPNFMGFSAGVAHINKNKKYDGSLNMLYSLNLMGGLEPFKLLSGIYVFVSASYNFTPGAVVPIPESKQTSIGGGHGWVGYAAGILLH